MKNYYRCLIKTVYKEQKDRHKGQSNRIWSSRFIHKLNNFAELKQYKWKKIDYSNY